VIAALGVGFIFVPMTITAVTGVDDTDAGVASATRNVGQQAGGAIGLAVLATAAASAGRDAMLSKIAALQAQIHAGQQPPAVLAHLQELLAGRAGAPVSRPALGDHVAVRVFDQIQAHSTSAGFLVGGLIAAAAVIVALTTISPGRPKEAPRANPALPKSGTSFPDRKATPNIVLDGPERTAGVCGGPARLRGLTLPGTRPHSHERRRRAQC
jgi:hypothetical protein